MPGSRSKGNLTTVPSLYSWNITECDIKPQLTNQPFCLYQNIWPRGVDLGHWHTFLRNFNLSHYFWIKRDMLGPKCLTTWCWLWPTFEKKTVTFVITFYPKKIQRGSKYETSSTKFVFFWPIHRQKWTPWPLVGCDIFGFSASVKRNLTKLDGRQVLNVPYQVFTCLKLIEIVILRVYYTIPFGFSIFRHFWASFCNFL